MPDLDRSLYDQLRRQSEEIALPSGNLDDVVARGRTRRRRYRATASLAAMVAAGAVTGGVLSHSGGGGPATTRLQDGNTGGTAPGPAPANAVLQWRATSASSALGFATSLAPGATEYALSTGPASAATTQPEPDVLWRSTDGRSWETVASPAGLTLGDVAGSGGTVYAVGTGTATAAAGGDPLAGGVRVASSTDGRSWTQTALPLHLPTGGGAVTVNDDILKVAAGPQGVVAVVTPGVNVNVGKLLPAGTPVVHWTVTSTGIDLLGAEKSNACPAGSSGQMPVPPAVAGGLGYPAGTNKTVKTNSGTNSGASGATPAAKQALAALRAAKSGALQKKMAALPTGPTSPPVSGVPCFDASGQVATIPATQAFPVTARYTWAQLHVPAAEVAEIEGDSFAFYSANGRSFRQVTIPAGSGVAQSLTASAGGFVLATENPVSGAPTVLQSPDGTHWTAYPLPAGVDGIAGAGEAGGQLVAVAQRGASLEVLTRSGAEWTPATVPGLSAATDGGKGPGVQQVAFGGAGVAAVVQTTSGQGSSTWQVLYSPNGVNWSATDLATASGGQVGSVASLAVGAASVTVTLQRPVSPSPGAAPTPAASVVVVGTPAGR